MADWKLEKLDPLVGPDIVDGDIGKGLVWLLTLTNPADAFVFAGAPAMLMVVRAVRAYMDNGPGGNLWEAVVAAIEALPEGVE